MFVWHKYDDKKIIFENINILSNLNDFKNMLNKLKKIKLSQYNAIEFMYFAY